MGLIFITKDNKKFLNTKTANLTATDQMSETLEKAGQKLAGFQKKLAEKGAEASRIGGRFMTMGNQTGVGMLYIVKTAAEYAKTTVTNATKAEMKTDEWIVRGLHSLKFCGGFEPAVP